MEGLCQRATKIEFHQYSQEYEFNMIQQGAPQDIWKVSQPKTMRN